MMVNIIQNYANVQDKDRLEKFYAFMSCVSNADQIVKSIWGPHYKRRCQALEAVR